MSTFPHPSFADKLRHLVIYLPMLLLLACNVSDPSIRIDQSARNANTEHGFAALAAALETTAYDVEWVASADDAQLRFALVEDGALRPEGFSLKGKAGAYSIEARDEAGLLYGLQELAEQVRLYGWEEVKETLKNPYMELRGIKLNIPLDARTPSYTDASEVAQQNIPTVWDMDFWRSFIDLMADYRYNFVSLWSLHPFPSLVKVPGYDDVALDEVHRSTHDWEEYYHLHATGIATPEIVANPEVIKDWTIKEKID